MSSLRFWVTVEVSKRVANRTFREVELRRMDDELGREGRDSQGISAGQWKLDGEGLHVSMVVKGEIETLFGYRVISRGCGRKVPNSP